MAKKSNGTLKFGVFTLSAITLIFLIVFFLKAFEPKEQPNYFDPTNSKVELTCASDLKISCFEEEDYSEACNDYKKVIDAKNISTNTSGDGKNFVSMVDGKDANYISLKVKISAEEKTNVYLSNSSKISTFDISGNRTCFAGMSRISILSNDEIISTFVPNDSYKLFEEGFSMRGGREDNYYYNDGSLKTYTLEDIMNKKLVLGLDTLSSDSLNMINSSPKLLELNANETKELTINIWFENTDRENSEYVDNMIDISLDFASIYKEKLSNDEETAISKIYCTDDRVLAKDKENYVLVSDHIVYSFNGIDFTGPYNISGNVLANAIGEYVYIKKSETLDFEESRVYKVLLSEIE